MTARQIRVIMNAVDRDAIADHFHQAEGDEDDREPFVVCGGVSVGAFNQYVGDTEDLPLGLRFLEFTADGRILIVELPTRVHEATRDWFNLAFMKASGNPRALSPAGSMTAHQKGKPDKEADASYGPARRTPNRTAPPPGRTLDDWVTVAVEVGRAQTWPSLENAARWWHGYDGLQYVLLLKISPRGRSLGYRLYDADIRPLGPSGELPEPVHLGLVDGADGGPPQSVVFDSRRVLAIPPGLPLPKGMNSEITVDLCDLRNVIMENF